MSRSGDTTSIRSEERAARVPGVERISVGIVRESVEEKSEENVKRTFWNVLFFNKD